MSTTVQLDDKQLLAEATLFAQERGMTVTAVIEKALHQMFTSHKNGSEPQQPEPATWYDPDKLLESEKLALGLIEPSREFDNLHDALMAWREKYVDEDWDFDPDEVFNGIRKEFVGRGGVVFE